MIANLRDVFGRDSSIQPTISTSFGSQVLDTEIVVHVHRWVALLAVALASACYGFLACMKWMSSSTRSMNFLVCKLWVITLYMFVIRM